VKNGSMLPYVLRRIVATLPALVTVSVLIFLMLRLASGDPAALLVGDLADAAELARVRVQMGLDQPLVVQYFAWASHVVTGDLGRSLMTGEPVLTALLRRFTVTLQVVLPAFLIAAMIAVPAGMTAARHRGRILDTAIVLCATAAVSLPSFWVSMLLIRNVGIELGWLPTLGFVPLSADSVDWAEHIVLPVTSLVLIETAILTRLVRATAIEVLNQDYIAYARSKGLPERLILWRHTLRNVLTPTMTMLGLILGSLLSGTAVIETVFGIPGLGTFLVDAIYARDYPTIQGTLLFIVMLYTLINLAVDLAYPLLDPRIQRA
jgi:peptide/nickel transport system permease protein